LYFEGVGRYFNIQSQHFLRERIKGYESTQAGYVVTRAGFEQLTFQVH